MAAFRANAEKKTRKEFEGYSRIWHEAAQELEKEITITDRNNSNSNNSSSKKKKKKKKKKNDDGEDDDEDDDFFTMIEEKEKIAKKALEERQLSSLKNNNDMSNNNNNNNNNSQSFKQLVQKNGTASDKIAQATVSVAQDPVGNLRNLETLLELCEKARVKGGKRGAAQAITALEELFKDVLLPNRKLKYFSDQEFLSKSHEYPHERKRLMYWFVEDHVKRSYNRFVQSLEALSKDPLVVLKEKSMKCAYGLLVSKPEQELQLLQILTNKLGDPTRKMASNASHLLLELTVKHPMMKSIVAREVEQFMFRRGVSLKAQYYGAVLLNQMPLSHKNDGPKLAKQLIETYFGLFQFF